MDDRMETLRSIRTEEQKKEYENSLNRYLIEYEWFVTNKDPLNSIKEKLKNESLTMKARNSLEERQSRIEKDTYRLDLERNILAYMLALKEWSAKEKGKSLSLYDIVMGFIRKDPDIKIWINDMFMKSRVEKMGLKIASPVNLELQSKEDVLKEVFKKYKPVSIPIPEVMETSLVPANPKENDVYVKMRELLDDCLKGINVRPLEAKPMNNNTFISVQRDNNQPNVISEKRQDNDKTQPKKEIE